MAIHFNITSSIKQRLLETQMSVIPIKPNKTKAWMTSIAAKYGYKIKNISIVFCSDEEILAVNKEFLGHDYFTDIITFEYTINRLIEGELYISLETVYANAQQFNVLPYNELYRVIAHGVLHLCGENDKTEKQKRSMHLAENIALEVLRLHNIMI